MRATVVAFQGSITLVLCRWYVSRQFLVHDIDPSRKQDGAHTNRIVCGSSIKDMNVVLAHRAHSSPDHAVRFRSRTQNSWMTQWNL